MPNNNFLFTVVGIVGAIFAICNLNMNNTPVRENWNNIQLGRHMTPVLRKKNGQQTGTPMQVVNPKSMANNRFVSVPKFDSIIAPRNSGGIGYGAHIRYNAPDRKNQGVPSHPLAHSGVQQANMVNENYSCGSSCGTGGLSKMGKVAGGYALPSDYMAGNKSELIQQAQNLPNGQFLENSDGSVNSIPLNAGPSATPITNELPVGTMNGSNVNGENEQFIVYNRLMYAPSLKSRTYGHSDYIRGDLAITPESTGWFQVSANPSTDLNTGAMNVMAGTNAVDTNMLELMQMSKGPSATAFGGMDLADPTVNMAPHVASTLSNSKADIVNVSYA
tara:strand:+ start:218 stop:1213 length:996 start_codon:yes stop_codon:yes gene_type:complete